MSMFKCKMCGGDLEVTQEMSVCECIYCGSKQTLPRLSDEKKNNLYDRAGHFRRNNEYDKAMAIYEQILNEDTEDAESYWSIVLCKYGIEYVEDPATHRRVPTVNRAQMTSVYSDENYKSALKYADAEQRAVYEAEAKEIEQIQKGILEISSKEEPFDVFICYKESDATGRRTPDSVLANDLYHQLTQEGFKVFFARITLEDKLGSAYEPYIFAALNSAKVMVVLGTKPEYFTAVWVKNEWSRFLAQIKGGANKALIPAYKDMDPYDLPEEFSHLQAQDMSKLGFMQDLIRGIKKITGANEKKASVQATSESVPTSNGAQALVERAFLFLEDGDFARADELCEQALNQDPKNSQAYVGKLMIERQICKQEALSEGMEELTENNYFQKALRFAEDGLKKELERCNQMIMDRNKDFTYEEAIQMVKENGVQGGIQAAIKVLESAIGKYESLLGWRDSESKIEECKSQKNALVDQLYQNTLELVDKHSSKKIDSKTMVEAMGKAVENLEYLGDYLDSKRILADCKSKKSLHEKKLRKARNRKIAQVACSVAAITFIIVVAVSIPKIFQMIKYNTAVACMEDREYEKAIDLFEALDDYKDSAGNADKCSYKLAKEYMEDGKYEKARKLFAKLSNYEDSEELVQECIFQAALSYMNAGEYEKAIEQFSNVENNYTDCSKYITQCKEAIETEGYWAEQYNKALQCKELKLYEDAIEILNEILDYKGSKELLEECMKLEYEPAYQKALSAKKERNYKDAIDILNCIPKDYKDTESLLEECTNLHTKERYQQALSLKKEKDYENAIAIFKDIEAYQDAKTQLKECQNLWSEEIYQTALAYKAKKEYKTAISVFTSIDMDGNGNTDNYKDIKAQIAECEELILEAERNKIYQEALAYKSNKSYEKAIEIFETLVEYNYKDVKAQIAECQNCIYQKAIAYKENGDFEKAILEFTKISTYQDAVDQTKECVWLKNKDKVLLAKQYQNLFSGTFKFDLDKTYQNWICLGVNSDGTVVSDYGDYYDTSGEYYNFSFDTSDWTDVVAVTAGYDHVVGLKADGTVVATGANQYGQCNVGEWTDVVKVCANCSATAGLRSDGSVLFAGDLYRNYKDIYNQGTDRIIDIFGYHSDIWLLKSDGTVEAIDYENGFYSYDANFTDIIEFEADMNDAYGLKSDGTVITTDTNSGYIEAKLKEIEGWEDVVEVLDGGGSYVAALKSDGTVYFWSYELMRGNKYYQQINSVIQKWTDIVAIEDLYGQLVGLRADGTVVTTDTELCDEVNKWTDIVAIIAEHSVIIGVKSDGSTVYAGKLPDKFDNWNVGVQDFTVSQE